MFGYLTEFTGLVGLPPDDIILPEAKWILLSENNHSPQPCRALEVRPGWALEFLPWGTGALDPEDLHELLQLNHQVLPGLLQTQGSAYL